MLSEPRINALYPDSRKKVGTHMKLRFPESQIGDWANSYSYSRGEEQLIELRPEIQKVGYLNREQLKLVALWKAPRSAGHVEKNDRNFVREITGWVFSAKEERSRIELLTLLDGVRFPSASVILHLFHPAPYPIIDFRALWSVGLNVPTQYKWTFWWPYVQYCREIAKHNSVDMRTLDRALWQYSKEKQPATK
jgi:hypothetical protein